MDKYNKYIQLLGLLHCVLTVSLIKFQTVKTTIDFLKEVRTELKKVTWPKKEEVIRLTLVVFIFSAIAAIYLGGLDLAFTKILESLIG